MATYLTSTFNSVCLYCLKFYFVKVPNGEAHAGENDIAILIHDKGRQTGLRVAAVRTGQVVLLNWLVERALIFD